MNAVLIPDMPIKDYHGDRSTVSSTGLKQLLRSPAHFRSYLDNPRDSETLRLGRVIHTALLEPDKFDAEHVVCPQVDRRTKVGKEVYERFTAEATAAGKTIVTEEELADLRGMIRSVGKHVTARRLLTVGSNEQSIFWTDEETGIRCRVRVDSMYEGCITDVKSTADASKRRFMYSCRDYGYDLSAAFYLEAIYQLCGDSYDFAFLAIEKSAPHACALYRAPSAMIAEGRAKFRTALRLYKECITRNEWPGYQPRGGFEDLDWNFRR